VKLSASPFRRPCARHAAFVLAAGLLVTPALAACGSSSPKSSASGSASGSSASSGVKVTGAFGQKPTLSVPGGNAPAKLGSEVLSQGNGPAVASGQTIVVNYLGQTWEPKDGKPNVFDNSFDRKQPVNFPIGKGQVIPGWDKTLVGQKAGSRVLLTIPPSEGYASDPSNALAKNTLLFVVDVLGSYDAGATASGSPADALPAGFPAVTSESGKVPTVTSVQGVTPGKDAKSALLLKGSGAAIDENRFLALNLLQVDAKTGKTVRSTFTTEGPQLVAAKDVLSVVPTLKGAKVGSRAMVISPAPAKGAKDQQAIVVVLDVLGEY
jgi:peptidylprolyl isomerase